MLEIKDRFYSDGEPFQIISGAVHYFRIVPEYWRDRLEKLKNMGCNTVETYIPWNFHEPRRGEFLWSGRHDVQRFIKIAGELGLYVIVRPSPYICAEWEFGGLPSWLLAERGMRLRCSYEPYLSAVRDYYNVLIPKLVPLQADRGGNIIMLQIENEYGYYGDDKNYLRFLRDTMRELGITVPFVTSDGPWGKAFEAGTVEGALPTGNFGSDVEGQFKVMREKIGSDKPLMCMEFWVGWFDAWGEEHHTSELEQNKKDLDALMRLGNVNFYMFAGGTNFGFMNGSNWGAKTADVTSYEYDGILTEDGQCTEKYYAFREIIGRYKAIEEVLPTTHIERIAYGEISLKRKTDLFANLGGLCEPVHSLCPLSMEEVGQGTGYILYRTALAENECVDEIRLEGAADRVLGYQNGKYLFTAFGDNLWESFNVEDKVNGSVIDLLAENCGRVNFGTGLEEQRKGICGSVRINDHRHFGFDIYPLPLDSEQIERLDFSLGCAEKAPAFYEFVFDIDRLGDTFLDFSSLGTDNNTVKGCAFVNGFNIGRFWSIGPQKRLYIPAPLLKIGDNRIIVFETEGVAIDKIVLTDMPSLK